MKEQRKKRRKKLGFKGKAMARAESGHGVVVGEHELEVVKVEVEVLFGWMSGKGPRF